MTAGFEVHRRAAEIHDNGCTPLAAYKGSFKVWKNNETLADSAAQVFADRRNPGIQQCSYDDTHSLQSTYSSQQRSFSTFADEGLVFSTMTVSDVGSNS